MSVVHGRRGAAGDDHVSRDTTTTISSSSTEARAATGGRPARFASALSANAVPFSMVPSSVRIRGAQSTTNPAGDAEGGKKARARRQQKPKAKPSKSASSSSQDDELEEKAPAPGDDARAASKNGKKKKKKTKAGSLEQQKEPEAIDSSEAKATNQLEADSQAKASTENEEEEEAEVCLLCADPIEFFAIGECNHLGVCSKCSMRMRLIMKDRNCPMCKTPLERVIVSSEPREFESFELWGDAAGWDSVLDEPSDMIYYSCKAHYDAMRRLREFGCPVKKCHEVLHTLSQLKEHLRYTHGAEFCELCLEHQTFFIQEQQVFTKKSIKAHNVGRNRATGPKQSTGNKDFHPVCQFCKKRFYGDLELFNHLERDHFKCHICKIEHEYYRNYASLETHFRREHHLCEDSKCLALRFVVFANDIDYQGHMSSVHGVHNRLLFNFQVARGGENPVAGGPGRMAGGDGPDYWHVDARQPAPIHAVADPLEAAFPALPMPGAPAPPPLAAPAIVRPAAAPPSTYRQTAPVSVAPRGMLLRNHRLKQALGLPGANNPDAIEEDMATLAYPQDLVKWAKANTGYLLVIERRLERVVTEPDCHSVSLRSMPSNHRALMHQLAEKYGVTSQSFGSDEARYISFFKKDGARVPPVLLSTFAGGLRPSHSVAGGRLTFMPLRGPSSAPPAAAAPAPAAVRPTPVNRGWEKIVKPKRPVVKDAWSDDEDDTENQNGQQIGGAPAEQAIAEPTSAEPTIAELVHALSLDEED